MAKYNGSIELISGITQANNSNFPLVDASAIQVNDDGQRLDEALNKINQKFNNITASGMDIDEDALNTMLEEVLG